MVKIFMTVEIGCGRPRRQSGRNAGRAPFPGPAFTAPERKSFSAVQAEQRQESHMLGTILIVILILLLLGALPRWGYSTGWGYGPSGGLGLILVIIIILVLLGRL
jgi:hypothetical protein